MLGCPSSSTLHPRWTRRNSSKDAPKGRAIKEAVKEIGPSEIRVSKSQTGFYRRHPFAATWTPGRYLKGNVPPLVLSVFLPRRDGSPRWKKKWSRGLAASPITWNLAPPRNSTMRCKAACPKPGASRTDSSSAPTPEPLMQELRLTGNSLALPDQRVIVPVRFDRNSPVQPAFRLCPRQYLWADARRSLSSYATRAARIFITRRRRARAATGVELLKMRKGLAAGDVVTVRRIDRLARSTFDLFVIVKQIVDAKAQFRSLAESWADTGTSTGRLMIAVLGGLADVDRDVIRTRTAENRGQQWAVRRNSPTTTSRPPRRCSPIPTSA